MRYVACSIAVCLAFVANQIFAPAVVEAGVFVSFQEGVGGYTGTQDRGPPSLRRHLRFMLTRTLETWRTFTECS